MTDDKRSKMLERVRALLAKADSTNFPAEADTFRAKADELMAAYAIEQWQVDAAQGAVGARPTPIRRDFDMSWYENNSRYLEIWMMMQIVARHCRIQLIHWRYRPGTIPAVGLQSDMDYFDLLFTHLMLQMAKGLEPKPNPDKTMIENLVAMKESGMKWERIGELLIGIGQLDKYDRNVGVKFTKLYTDYCEEHDRPRLRTSPSVWQRSYSEGFVNEIRARLKHQEDVRGTGMELALRDIADEVAKAAGEMFGAAPEGSYGVAKEMAHNPNAYEAGRVDGRKANISANPNESIKQRAAGELSS